MNDAGTLLRHMLDIRELTAEAFAPYGQVIAPLRTGGQGAETSYDPEADAMFVWFGPEGVTSSETEEVAPGVMLDFDNKGEVIGVEILYVSRRMAKAKAA